MLRILTDQKWITKITSSDIRVFTELCVRVRKGVSSWKELLAVNDLLSYYCMKAGEYFSRYCAGHSVELTLTNVYRMILNYHSVYICESEFDRLSCAVKAWPINENPDNNLESLCMFLSLRFY
jgi:hypothetical protein